MLFSWERGVCSVWVCAQCQVFVAPHQNMSERALRAFHIHISTSALQHMEWVVLLWTLPICPQSCVAFYFIHTCKLLNWIKHTNTKASLGIFWIWWWVLNVGLVAPWLFELSVFLQILSGYSSLPSHVRWISSRPQVSEWALALVFG